MILDATELARDWTARRVAIPLAGSSAVLARDPAFPAAARMNALFVSRTTSANALAALRGQIEGVLAGGTTPERAAQVLRAAFEADQGAAGLVSPGRAREIVRLQAMQAYAVGERAVALHPAVADAFPYWRYEATQDSRTRPAHARLDGLVLRKDDPFWRTHTPPWEFGCRCALSPVSEDEAQALGVAQARTHDGADGSQSATVVTARGETVNLPGNESGYTFDVDGAFRSSDMGQVKELKDRREILGEMTAAARESGAQWQFIARQELPAAEPRLPRPEAEIEAEIARVTAGEVESVSLGELLPEHADGLGLQPDEHEVRLSSTDRGHEFGTGHWSMHHADTLPQAVGMLKETLWQPGSEARLAVRGKVVRLLLWNRGMNRLAAFLKKGRQWQLQTIDAWSPTAGYRKAAKLE